VPPGWWTLFADPELSRLEALAVAANQDLVAAMHRVDAARADFRVPAGGSPPQFAGRRLHRPESSSANFTQLPGFTPPEVSQYRLTSGLSYEVDLWGKVRRKTEAARANLAGAAFERDAVMLRLTGEVGEQYYNLDGRSMPS